jgi:hypothetical protein
VLHKLQLAEEHIQERHLEGHIQQELGDTLEQRLQERRQGNHQPAAADTLGSEELHCQAEGYWKDQRQARLPMAVGQILNHNNTQITNSSDEDNE